MPLTKEQKRRLLNDPMARLRRATRIKTQKLIQRGKLKKKPCLVCGIRKVIAHHEDYLNPFRIIWMCEPHHKEYHDGKIALFNGTLKWDPARLTPKLPIHRRGPQSKQQTKRAIHSQKGDMRKDEPSEPSAAPF